MAVFDTHLLIDYLNGAPMARTTLLEYEDPAISRVTWVEVLAGAINTPSENSVRAFLASFILLEIDGPVSEEAIRLRADRGLKLPDAIILATARVKGCLLLTRNTRDFKLIWPEIREPYQL
ncbi:MAG: type II toxin-antitoxin system VapC family toxin [Verrucomicrobia bacterium]|nr:type II toxin-antitoxin system VapC family toxin [Verrucomicrobiota bacterium]